MTCRWREPTVSGWPGDVRPEADTLAEIVSPAGLCFPTSTSRWLTPPAEGVPASGL